MLLQVLPPSLGYPGRRQLLQSVARFCRSSTQDFSSRFFISVSLSIVLHESTSQTEVRRIGPTMLLPVDYVNPQPSAIPHIESLTIRSRSRHCCAKYNTADAGGGG